MTKRIWIAVALGVGLVTAMWAGGGGASLAQDYSPSADPLPITRLIEVEHVASGRTVVWYAEGPGVQFPYEGEFVFTHWDTRTGTVQYKARVTVGPAQIVPITDREVHDAETP